MSLIHVDRVPGTFVPQQFVPQNLLNLHFATEELARENLPPLPPPPPALDPPPPVPLRYEIPRSTRTSFAAPRVTPFADRPPRLRSYLKGLIVYGNGAFTLDCAIQDISEGGAKIALVKNQALPAEVYLIVVKRAVAYRAKVVWQKSPSRGLQFCEAHQMKWPLPDDIQFLRRYWIDRCARPGVPT